MRKLISFFIQGFIFVAPLCITVYILFLVFEFFDGILPFKIPGLGILIIIVFVTLLGFIGQTIIGRPIRFVIERTIGKAPFIQAIYSSIKDLLSAFVGKEKKFNQPVLVKVNKISNLEKIGFMTKENLSDLNIEDKVAVYFPHCYAVSGELFIVPREDVKPLDIPAAEAMKFIVSGGVTKV